MPKPDQIIWLHTDKRQIEVTSGDDTV